MFVVAVASVCLCASAWADEIPSCRLPPHAESVSLISNTPKTLRDAIQADIGDLANPGEDFNSTDVVEGGLLFKRLIFIWHSAELWIVATESGGIAYNDPIYAYRLKQGKAILLETSIAFPNTVCAVPTAYGLNNGHKSGQNRKWGGAQSVAQNRDSSISSRLRERSTLRQQRVG